MSPSKVPPSVLAALGLLAVDGCGWRADGTPSEGANSTMTLGDEPDVGPCLEYVPDPLPDTDTDDDPKPGGNEDSDTPKPPPPPPPEPDLGPCLSPLPPPVDVPAPQTPEDVEAQRKAEEAQKAAEAAAEEAAKESARRAREAELQKEEEGKRRQAEELEMLRRSEPESRPCLRMMPRPRPSPDAPEASTAPGSPTDDARGAVLERGVLPSDVAELLRSRKG